MRRLQHATRVLNGNGTGKDGFGEGNITTQVPATVISAEWLNDVQEEILNVITSAGLTPSTSRTQLAEAIAIAATGSSSANAISIRGTSILTTAPTTGDVIQHNGTAYTPGKLTNANVATAAAIAVNKLAYAGTADGWQLGISGGAPAWTNGATVLRSVGVSAATPQADDILRISGGSWSPGKLAGANIAGGAISLDKLVQPDTYDQTIYKSASGLAYGNRSWYGIGGGGNSQLMVVPTIDSINTLIYASPGGTIAGLSAPTLTGTDYRQIPAAFQNSSGSSTLTIESGSASSPGPMRFFGAVTIPPSSVKVGILMYSPTSGTWRFYA